MDLPIANITERPVLDMIRERLTLKCTLKGSRYIRTVVFTGTDYHELVGTAAAAIVRGEYFNLETAIVNAIRNCTVDEVSFKPVRVPNHANMEWPE